MCICQIHCMHRKRPNKRMGVSAALCILKRQRTNIREFVQYRALPAATDLILIPHIRLLPQGHIREQPRTGEAKTKVTIDSLLPRWYWLLRKHWSLQQPWEKAGWIHGRGKPLRAAKYTEDESGSGCVWATDGCTVLGGEGMCCLRLSSLMLPTSKSAFGAGSSFSYFIMLLFTAGRRRGLEASQDAGCSPPGDPSFPRAGCSTEYWLALQRASLTGTHFSECLNSSKLQILQAKLEWLAHIGKLIPVSFLSFLSLSLCLCIFSYAEICH